jgi:undecaprenyl-diphosphatase
MGANAILDFFMSALSNKTFGAILFILLGIVLLFRFGRKTGAHFCALVALALYLADFVSRHVVKEVVIRPRPRFVSHMCYKPYCFGFVSSHATDFFAVAAVFIFIDRRNSVWALPLGFLVCISRLFLFDHFPLDVIGGAAIGLSIGSTIYWTDWFFVRKQHCGKLSLVEPRDWNRGV